MWVAVMKGLAALPDFVAWDYTLGRRSLLLESIQVTPRPGSLMDASAARFGTPLCWTLCRLYSAYRSRASGLRIGRFWFSDLFSQGGVTLPSYSSPSTLLWDTLGRAPGDVLRHGLRMTFGVIVATPTLL